VFNAHIGHPVSPTILKTPYSSPFRAIMQARKSANAHRSGCIVIERNIWKKRKKIGHWALTWFLRRERNQSLCHRRLTQGRCR
jgi:hypothetical protein